MYVHILINYKQGGKLYKKKMQSWALAAIENFFLNEKRHPFFLPFSVV